MLKVENVNEYTIEPEELAKWLDQQPDSWWSADGDPVLMTQIDFPCPSSELAEAIRRQTKPLCLLTQRCRRVKDGRVRLASRELDELSNTDNRDHAKTLLFRWEGSQVQWLLSEEPSQSDKQA